MLGDDEERQAVSGGLRVGFESLPRTFGRENTGIGGVWWAAGGSWAPPWRSRC